MFNDIAKIRFGAPDDPLAELAPYDQRAEAKREPMSLTPAMRTYLSAFVQFVPALAASAAQATTQAYTLSFKPGVLEQASGLMKASDGGWRATAVSKSGRIVGQGRLDQISNVRVLSSAVAVWQVMAVITAQVHLAELNERLAQIERGIDDIKAWLEADKIATLLNAQRYVLEIREAFATRSLTERDIVAFEQQLERLWVDCGQVETALRLLLDPQSEQFRQLGLGSLWGLDSQVAARRMGSASMSA
jgi:hypothetical protein